MVCCSPVSYTHLDVYKRQVQGRTLVREYRFLGNREKIRESTVAAALTFARSCLLEHLGEKG